MNKTVKTIDQNLAKWQEMVNKGEMSEMEQARLINEWLMKNYGFKA